MFESLKKDAIIFIFFLILVFFTAYSKDIFSLNWWNNFDMDIFILSNSISILQNNTQSFFDHPGLVPILLFSVYLLLIDFFNILGFELFNLFHKKNFLIYIEEVVIHLRIFNILSIGILLFTFYKLFNFHLKNIFLSILFTISLFINIDFLSFNFHPVRTEIFSLIFLNCIFLFSINSKIVRTISIILGLFLGLAIFSKIQVILIFFIYIMIFRYKFFIDAISLEKFNFNYLIFNFLFSIIIYFFNGNLIDSFTYFLLLSFFYFYFYKFDKSKLFPETFFSFIMGFILLLIFFYFNFDYRNIEVALSPIQNSMRWAQERYILNKYFELDKLTTNNIPEFLNNYKNYIVIITINFFLIFKKKNIKEIIILNVIFFSVIVIWTLFSQRSGLLRYGIYMMPLFYLFLSLLLFNEKHKFKLKILLLLFFINLFMNFSFVSTKYKSVNNLSNIRNIHQSCYNLNEQKNYNYLNYFFSANKKDIKTICSSLRQILK